MYGLIDISELEVILRTCNITDIPPKPSKNAHIIILILIAFIGILDIIETPFVSSTMPESRPFAKEGGMFNKVNIGDRILDKKSKTPVLLSIEIITLKSITNPPIITTVFIDVIILF